MKKDPSFQLNHFNGDLLKQKQKLYTNPPNSQSQLYTTSSKKIITQSNNFQPPTLQPCLFSARSQDYSSTQPNRSSASIHPQSIQNPQKIKSSSFHEKSSKTNHKFEYLAYVQKQYKQQKQKKGQQYRQKGNGELTVEPDNRLKDELKQIKIKMEKYYSELQRQDELMVKKEKQLFESGRQLELAKQRIRELEEQSLKLQQNNQTLYEQCLHYQQDQQYYEKLTENYHILSQRCTQLEQILQQKDHFIQSVIKTKGDQYNAAINSKNHQIKALEDRIVKLQQERSQLKAKIKKIETENQTIKQAPELDTSKFQAFGQQFENKINYYVNQNTRLKNLIGRFEGEVQQLKTQKQSLESTLRAYEDRDKHQKTSKLQGEVFMLRDALEREKMEKDQLISKHELEILKLQNQLSTKRLQGDGSLINLYDKQRLHQSLYFALEEVEKLNQKLSSYGLKLK